MGPIGWPETVFIFFLALILFGPKKLPELGRTVGKALADFQRAKGEIQAAFDREKKQLMADTKMGLDTEMLTGLANEYRFETSAVDASLYGSGFQSSGFQSSGFRSSDFQSSDADTSPSDAIVTVQ